jgi:hypothetical protein
LPEPITVPIASRVSFTILDMDPAIQCTETAILSEENLAEDWNRPEEDWAWDHLQKAP